MTELFNTQFTHALMYGMTPDEYWHGEADLFWAYRTSFIKKQEYEFERENHLLWLSGVYQRQVLFDWWTKTHETKGKIDYFEKPIDFNEKKKEETLIDLDKKKREENERNIRFMIAKSHNALIKQKKQQ